MKFILQKMRFTVLSLFVFFVVPVGTSTVDDVIRLLDKANSKGYDKRVRPLKNQTNAIEVKLGLILYSVIDFDQRNEALHTSVQLLVSWQDELLAWDKDEYGGIHGLLFPQDDIWKPDLRLNNSYNSFIGFGSSDMTVWVSNDGNATWFPIQALESQCAVNTKKFPYDTQTCSLFFESAAYPSWQLKLLREGEDGLQLKYYQHNSAWELVSTSTVEHEPRAVEFKLVLKRLPDYYLIHIFTPIILLTFLGPLTFLLPADDGGRSSFAIALFLTFGVFLTNVASELPKNSEEKPHLSLYIVVMGVFHFLIVLISIVQTRSLWKHKDDIEMNIQDASLVFCFTLYTLLTTAICFGVASN